MNATWDSLFIDTDAAAGLRCTWGDKLSPAGSSHTPDVPGAPVDPLGPHDGPDWQSSSPLNLLRAAQLLQGGVMRLRSEVKSQHSSSEKLIKPCLHLPLWSWPLSWTSREDVWKMRWEPVSDSSKPRRLLLNSALHQAANKHKILTINITYIQYIRLSLFPTITPPKWITSKTSVRWKKCPLKLK